MKSEAPQEQTMMTSSSDNSVDHHILSSSSCSSSSNGEVVDVQVTDESSGPVFFGFHLQNWPRYILLREDEEIDEPK